MKVLIQRVMQSSVKSNTPYKSTGFEKSTVCKKRVQNSVNEYSWAPYFHSIPKLTILLVLVDGEIISSTAKGLCVFVGILRDDTVEDINYITRKILNIKFFEDDTGKKWSKNVVEKQFEIMCVSQFTLCHSLKGNKLDFHYAMKPNESEKFYESFLESLRKLYKPEKIKNGKFGAYMQVELCNDGPVTIELDSRKEKNIIEKTPLERESKELNPSE